MTYLTQSIPVGGPWVHTLTTQQSHSIGAKPVYDIKKHGTCISSGSLASKENIFQRMKIVGLFE